MQRAAGVALATLLLAAGAPAAQASRSEPSSDHRQSGPRALFFGDSYFVGGGCSPDPDRGMAHVAARDLGYAPVIRGAGGTGYVAGNPDYGVAPYLTQIRAGAFDVRDPALVVIEGGSNDVGLPLTRVRRNARTVLRIAERRFPDARIIVVGPMQTFGPWSRTNGIRDAIRAVSRRLGLRFVDPQRWTAGHDEWLCADYVHPTYRGHRILGRRLSAALAKRGA